MSIVVIAHYRAREGEGDRVRAALHEMIQPSRDEPGNQAYEVSVDPHDPSVFAIYERYDDDDAFTAHTSSPHFERWLRGETIPYLRERVRHELVPLLP